MSQTLRIINPNWNTAVTESMSSALDGMRHDGGPQLDCVSLEGGPFGTESEADSIRVAPLLAEDVKSDNEADAFVIACYARHRRHMQGRLIHERCASDRPLGLSVADIEGGADVIIMGCAGMAKHRAPLEDALGVPVIDPTQAAVSITVGTLGVARG